MSERAFVGRISGSTEDYAAQWKRGLEYIRFGDGLPENPKVFIKPNLTFPTYKPGVMTSREAVEGAIVALRDYTDRIWIGDSDSGGYYPFTMEEVYTSIGLPELAKAHGVELVNLSRLERTSHTFTRGRRTVTFELPRLLTREIDAFVTMPVPKIHMNTGVSLTFKNQWGCIPEPQDRLRLHPYFKEAVVAINEAMKARYVMMDGRYGLNRSGPMRGDPVELNWVCVADGLGTGARIACELMRVDLEKIDHLRHARQMGLVPRVVDIELSSDLDDLKAESFHLKREWTDWPGALAFRSRLIAHLAYFSRLSGLLHKILYLFREPFYDYDTRKDFEDRPPNRRR